MPRHPIILQSSRQQIRELIAEHRGVSIAEVPYPSANMTFFQYSLELEFISQEDYDHYVGLEMRRQSLQRNRVPRPRSTSRNLTHQQMIGLMSEVSDYMTSDVLGSFTPNHFSRIDVLNIIIRGMNLMNYRLNQLSGNLQLDNQVREHPMEGVSAIDLIYSHHHLKLPMK